MGLQEISSGVSHRDGQECRAYELGGNLVKVGEDGNQFCVFNNILETGKKSHLRIKQNISNITDYPAKSENDSFMLELIRRLILFLQYLED